MGLYYENWQPASQQYWYHYKAVSSLIRLVVVLQYRKKITLQLEQSSCESLSEFVRKVELIKRLIHVRYNNNQHNIIKPQLVPGVTARNMCIEIYIILDNYS